MYVFTVFAGFPLNLNPSFYKSFLIIHYIAVLMHYIPLNMVIFLDFWTVARYIKNHQGIAKLLFKVNVSICPKNYQTNCRRDDPGSHGFHLYFFYIWITVFAANPFLEVYQSQQNLTKTASVLRVVKQGGKANDIYWRTPPHEKYHMSL